MKIIISSLLILFLSTLAHAESQFGINYTSIDIEADFLGVKISGPSPDMLVGKYSVNHGGIMSSELRLGIGLGEDKLMGTEWEIKNMFGAYLKWHMSDSEVKPYLIAGFTKGKLKIFADGSNISMSEDDFSYGAGLDFSNGLNLEYMNYLDKDGISFQGLGVGFNF